MISTTAPSRTGARPVLENNLADRSRSAGRSLLPPPARRYSPISVMTFTFDTVSRPNSRSMAARSSRSSSKTSFALPVAGVAKHGPLRGTVIRKLHVDAEIFAAKQGNDLLQSIAIFAAHAYQVTLDRSLYFLLRVLD